MRILITGSGGRLGRLLFRARSLGHCSKTELLFQSRQDGRDVKWQPGDDLARLPRCDMVVGLWGVTSGPPEILSRNSDLARLSQEVARATGACTVLHLSSAGVYGPGDNMNETYPTRPSGAYGAAKLAMEEAVLGLETGDFVQSALRLANVVGADSLAPALTRPEAAVLDRFTDGRGPLRSYIGAVGVLEVLEGLSRVAPDDLPPRLNVAAPAPVAMADLLRAASKPITWQAAGPDKVQKVTLDVSAMHRLLPDVAPVSEAHGLIAELHQLGGLE